jgi:hypothetical protein
MRASSGTLLRSPQQVRQLGDVGPVVAHMSLVRDERHDRMDKNNDHSCKHSQRDSFIDARAANHCYAFHSFPPPGDNASSDVLLPRCTASVNDRAIVSLNALRGVEAGYVSARNHHTAGFDCEPKALPAERTSAAERSPRYKPRPTMLVRRASRLEAWWCSIYHRHRCSGPHWPANWKQERPHKQRRSVVACFRT